MMTRKQTVDALELMLGVVQDCDMGSPDKMKRCLLTLAFMLGRLLKEMG